MANFGKIMQLFDNLTREITVGIYTVTGRLETIAYNCYSNSNDILCCNISHFAYTAKTKSLF